MSRNFCAIALLVIKRSPFQVVKGNYTHNEMNCQTHFTWGIHDQIEIILNSGNEWAINFLARGVDQITKKVRDEEEMRDQLCKLTDVVAHVVDRLDLIESNLAVSGTEKGVAL